LPTPSPSKSFWHSEPSSFLLGHRTTADLPSSADVVIIGSGITGASVARYLKEEEGAAGLSVVMLEAREACWGATGRNGGHCQPIFLHQPPSIGRFELRNFHSVATYISTHAVPCEFRPRPSVRALHSSALLAHARASVADLRASAPDLAEHLAVVTDPERLKDYKLRSEVPDGDEAKWNPAKGAVVCDIAGSLWPYKLVAHILEACVTAGRLNLQTTTPVEKIERIADSGDMAGGPRYRVITTHRGAIEARHVVLATNGYTTHLLPELADLIVPSRGQMSALRATGGERLGNSYGFLGVGDPRDNDHPDYLIQRPVEGGGQMMLGGGYAGATREYVGEVDDGVVDEGVAGYLTGMLGKVMTVAEGPLEAEYMWTGIMAYSRDGCPWVGAVPGMEGVWLSAGYTGHGMPNATLCGKAVVDMLLAKERGSFDEPFVDTMVHAGDIPRQYVISEERIERARHLPSVEVQNKEG
ncbi:FAD dependent oxidoreductase, partial [Eremomyces bilateralis CBS 781.70]